MKEVWKDIPDYIGHYQVSNLGRVKSLKNKIILKPAYNNDGRAMISLCRNSIQNNRQLGCWMLDAFKGVKNDPSFTCSHLDGDCTNISLSNLVYESASDNYSRRKQHGTAWDQRGSLSNSAKLTEQNVIDIKQHIVNGKHSLTKIAEAYHVDASLVSMINTNKRWEHIKWPKREG